MEMARVMGAEGKRVGVLFGPERAGLENEDIVRANAIVTVPVNAVAVLPQRSLTVQVRITVNSFLQSPLMVSSVRITARLALHASSAVTTGASGSFWSHCSVRSAGTPTRTGASLSTTVTVCMALLVLPQSSEADQVRTSWKLPGTRMILTLLEDRSMSCVMEVCCLVSPERSP